MLQMYKVDNPVCIAGKKYIEMLNIASMVCMDHCVHYYCCWGCVVVVPIQLKMGDPNE